MSEQDANENIARKRAVEDYKNAILRSAEHDDEWSKQAYSPNYDKHQMQWNMERSKQLDGNEAVAKQQYEEWHCEKETGLSADGFRSQVFDERRQQLAADSDRNRDISETENHEQPRYPLLDHRAELLKDADREKAEYKLNSNEGERDYWTKRSYDNGIESRNAEDKLNRFQQDNAKGLARESAAKREGRPLSDDELKADESAVRGFEDLENGRKTQEGYDAGIRRYDARIDSDKETISENQRLAKIDRSVGDMRSYNSDLDHQTDAANDIQKAEDEKYDFQNNYWSSKDKSNSSVGADSSAEASAECDNSL